jgi:adenylylsulfate kinase
VTAPATIWITGISAAGKSTLGSGLCDALRAAGMNEFELLDGEEVRARLTRKYGYSTEERNALAFVIGEMALEANEAGRVAIVCAISHVRETRQRIRTSIGRFMEVYLDCPVEVAADRDYKHQYEKALAGEIDNFIGVTEPYQASDDPELVLHTGKQSPAECLAELVKATFEFLDVDATSNTGDG